MDLGLSAYSESLSSLAARSVPVTVLILARDEVLNIDQCLGSVQWAEQSIVIDSGSSDGTQDVARRRGSEVVETHWRGYGAQREFALRLTQIRHDWVYFVDADEWVSVELAGEIARLVEEPGCNGYWQYMRLVFQGRWIRHCGWYRTGRLLRLMNRRFARYDDKAFSEHAIVAGPVGKLDHDIVDEDHKGLAQWLRKHVSYAELETERRLAEGATVESPVYYSRVQLFLKDRVARRLPGRAVFQFVYMYILRRGFLDGRQGLLFCFLHAWFQVVIEGLKAERRLSS